MSIEENYIQKIEEIKQVAESLTEFETKFIFGDAESRPLLERDSISDKQKALIDRIYKERVQEMDREAAATISFGNENIVAVLAEGNKTYRTAIDQVQVGPVLKYAEAVAVVAWLTTSVKEKHISVAVPEQAAQPAEAEGEFPGE